MIDWEIRRFERGEGGMEPGALVASVRAFGGVGNLEIIDEAYRETLEELFTQEQFVLAGRESIPGGEGAASVADMLEPWRPETLEYVRRRLPTQGLVAQDRTTSQ